MVTAKFTVKPKNCNKGWQCGSTCISRSNNCRITVSSKSKTLLDQIANYGGTGGGNNDAIVKDLLSKKAWSEADTANYNKIINSITLKEQVKLGAKAIKTGNEDLVKVPAEKPSETEPPKPPADLPSDTGYKPTSEIRKPLEPKYGSDDEALAAYKTIMKESKGKAATNIRNKVKKNSKKNGLSKLEAVAMSQWVSSSYSPINQQRLGIGGMPIMFGEKLAEISNHYLGGAIKKSKKYDKDKDFRVAGIHATGDYNLRRDMMFYDSKVAADFIKRKVVDAEANNGVTSNDTFDAFTGYQEPVFGGNIVVKLNAKKDSSGALVDEYKNFLDEAEVLFDVGTQFKLDSIKSYDKGLQKRLDKVLEDLKKDGNMDALTALFDEEDFKAEIYMSEV